MKTMNPKTYILLEAAFERFERLVKNGERKWKPKDLLHAQTGHGTATEYKQVVKDGYMTHANKPRPFHLQHWKLTDKGVEVLLDWKKNGKPYG